MSPSCMNMIVGKQEARKTHGLVMAICQTSFEGGVLDQTNSVWWENMFGGIEKKERKKSRKKERRKGKKKRRKKMRR